MQIQFFANSIFTKISKIMCWLLMFVGMSYASCLVFIDAWINDTRDKRLVEGKIASGHNVPYHVIALGFRLEGECFEISLLDGPPPACNLFA